MKPKPSALLGSLIIASGVLLAAYPFASRWTISRSQTEVIQQYQVSVDELSRQERQAIWDEAQAYNAQLLGVQVGDPFIPDSGFALPDHYYTTLDVGGVMGYLEIPAIDVYLPIYHSVGEDVLRKGVGHMADTSLPVGGEGTHSVLTAHRALPSARLFTDLPLLEAGDLFHLNILDRVLSYEVDDIQVVQPNETDNLRPVAGQDYVTLVTCTPYAINSHRLFVRGTRVWPEQEAEAETTSRLPFYRQLGPTAAVVVVAGAGTAWAIRLRRKRT